MEQSNELKRLQQLLIGSGAFLIVLGGIAGFGFLFFLLGEINLWPFPIYEYQMPGTIKAWRMSHLEGILGGFMQWIMAAIIPLMPFTIKATKRMVYLILPIGWMFTIASLMDALFLESRGLAIGGPLTNSIAFFLFYVGIVVLMYFLVVIGYRSLTNKDYSNN